MKNKELIYKIMPFISLVVFIALWFWVSSLYGKLIASPYDVLLRLIRIIKKPLSGRTLSGHIFISLQRVLIALSLAIVAGIPMGILIGWNKYFRATIGTVFEFVRPIPPLAWIPLIIAWFGIGETSKVALVFLAALTPIVVNSYTAIRLVPSLYIDVGKMFNASSERQILMKIVFPASLPSIFAGIRNATSVSFMVVLAAEMIGAEAGLGFLILRGMESFDIALIMSGIAMIGIVGVLLAVLTNFIERKVCPWNTGTE